MSPPLCHPPSRPIESGSSKNLGLAPRLNIDERMTKVARSAVFAGVLLQSLVASANKPSRAPSGVTIPHSSVAPMNILFGLPQPTETGLVKASSRAMAVAGPNIEARSTETRPGSTLNRSAYVQREWGDGHRGTVAYQFSSQLRGNAARTSGRALEDRYMEGSAFNDVGFFGAKGAFIFRVGRKAGTWTRLAQHLGVPARRGDLLRFQVVRSELKGRPGPTKLRVEHYRGENQIEERFFHVDEGANSSTFTRAAEWNHGYR